MTKTPKTRAKAAPEKFEPVDLGALLRQKMADFSPAEQNLAGYMLDNLQLLPFETGATIARATGVSEMTVTRFIRGLGFENLRTLKNHLRPRGNPHDGKLDDLLERFHPPEGRDAPLRESLRLELDAVVAAYSLTATPAWGEAVATLARVHNVFVVGFQGSKGLALDFASRLLWVRPQVIFIGNTSGTFAEILTADPKESAIVLVDTASYAKQALLLAAHAKEAAIPLVVVTDRFSHWAYAYTNMVFQGRTHVRMFWDSTSSLGVILNLMTDSVARKLGPAARQHFTRVARFGTDFGEFSDVATIEREDRWQRST